MGIFWQAGRVHASPANTNIRKMVSGRVCADFSINFIKFNYLNIIRVTVPYFQAITETYLPKSILNRNVSQINIDFNLNQNLSLFKPSSK